MGRVHTNEFLTKPEFRRCGGLQGKLKLNEFQQNGLTVGHLFTHKHGLFAIRHGAIEK